MSETTPHSNVANLSFPESRWRGFGKTGEELDRVVFDVAADIEQIWAAEFAEGNQSLDLDFYSRVINRVEPFAKSVLIRALEWSTTRSEILVVKRKQAESVVNYSLILASVRGVRRITRNYPGLVFDQINLIQENVLNGWLRLSQDDGLQILNEIDFLGRLNAGTYSQFPRLKREQNQQTTNEDQIIDPDQSVIDQDLRGQLEDVLGSLPLIERGVVAYRFGLLGGSGETLEEVGRRIGLDEEAIRKIEGSALHKLRQRALARKISDFYPKSSKPDPEEANLNGVVNALAKGDKERAARNAISALRKMIYAEDNDDQKIIAKAKEYVAEQDRDNLLIGRGFFAGQKIRPNLFYYNIRICLYALDN